MVDLLEHQAVAGGVLVEIAFDGGSSARRPRRRVPRAGTPARPVDADQGHRAGVVMGVMELVHGQVGEQAAVGIHPPGGQPAAGGDEHPQVGVAGQAHQEGVHAMIGRDPVEHLFAIHHDEATVRGPRPEGRFCSKSFTDCPTLHGPPPVKP